MGDARGQPGDGGGERARGRLEQLAHVVTLPLIVLVGWIDWVTGREIAVSIFYLAPVLLVALYGSATSVLLASLLAAGAWTWADHAAGSAYSHELIGYWNGAVRLGFFLVVGFTVARLRVLQARERLLARTDPLTGLLNRRAFLEALEHELARARRSKRPFSLALLDLDGFKSINDRLGHAVGDAVLTTVATSLRQNLRDIDTLARLGGDEFAALLVWADAPGAAATLRRATDALHDELEARGWEVSASIGATTCTDAGDANAEALLHRVDELMYRAKSGGGGRVEYGSF
jgi:diguanylate cyclase (GGDEF)-like protein